MDTTRVLEFFRRRQRNYQLTFQKSAPWALAVLEDLEGFCHVNTTTAISNDPIGMAVREGRRQVFQRIARAIRLSAEEQLILSTKKDQP